MMGWTKKIDVELKYVFRIRRPENEMRSKKLKNTEQGINTFTKKLCSAKVYINMYVYIWYVFIHKKIYTKFDKYKTRPVLFVKPHNIVNAHVNITTAYIHESQGWKLAAFCEVKTRLSLKIQASLPVVQALIGICAVFSTLWSD